jgi:hypothetical protein
MLAAAESQARKCRRRPRRDTGRAMAQEKVELVREIIAAVPDVDAPRELVPAPMDSMIASSDRSGTSMPWSKCIPVE